MRTRRGKKGKPAEEKREGRLSNLGGMARLQSLQRPFSFFSLPAATDNVDLEGDRGCSARRGYAVDPPTKTADREVCLCSRSAAS
jgi:hypothetical protein